MTLAATWGAGARDGKAVVPGWGWRHRANRAAGRGIGPGMILVSSAAIQASAVLSVGVFAATGALATSGLRFAAAALILLLVARPRLSGRSWRSWLGIVIFGAAMAVMNIALYQAIARIPLGSAVTIEFLGPFCIAAAGTRRLRDALWVVLAAGGVAALSHPSAATGSGLAFAALAAAGWAGYVLANKAVGEQSSGIDGLALSVTVAALVTLPLAVPALPSLRTRDVVFIFLSAALGICLAYTLEMRAIRRTSARMVSILFSLDPAVGALAGLLFLGQHLSAVDAGGLACVVIASVGVAMDTPVPPG